MCAVITLIFGVRLSLLFVVTFCKCRINPTTSPNAVYSHSKIVIISKPDIHVLFNSSLILPTRVSSVNLSGYIHSKLMSAITLSRAMFVGLPLSRPLALKQRPWEANTYKTYLNKRLQHFGRNNACDELRLAADLDII
jgi:hypothetical protein